MELRWLSWYMCKRQLKLLVLMRAINGNLKCCGVPSIILCLVISCVVRAHVILNRLGVSKVESGKYVTCNLTIATVWGGPCNDELFVVKDADSSSSIIVIITRSSCVESKLPLLRGSSDSRRIVYCNLFKASFSVAIKAKILETFRVWKFSELKIRNILFPVSLWCERVFYCKPKAGKVFIFFQKMLLITIDTGFPRVLICYWDQAL